MKKTLILLGILAITPLANAQVVLEALDAPSLFSSTKTSTASRSFRRNNCGAGYTGGYYTVSRSASGSATSTVSQADADNKAGTIAYNNAMALVNSQGQSEANLYGSCTANTIYYTSTQTRTASRTFTRNNCGTGYTGGSWTVSRSASGSATSTVSQADADSKASTNAYNNAMALVNSQGQSEANSYGSCTAIAITYSCSETIYKKMMPVCTPQTIILSQRTYYSNRDESVREQMISTFFAQCENINDTSGWDVGWVAKDVTCTVQ